MGVEFGETQLGVDLVDFCGCEQVLTAHGLGVQSIQRLEAECLTLSQQPLLKEGAGQRETGHELAPVELDRIPQPLDAGGAALQMSMAVPGARIDGLAKDRHIHPVAA